MEKKQLLLKHFCYCMFYVLVSEWSPFEAPESLSLWPLNSLYLCIFSNSTTIQKFNLLPPLTLLTLQKIQWQFLNIYMWVNQLKQEERVVSPHSNKYLSPLYIKRHDSCIATMRKCLSTWNATGHLHHVTVLKVAFSECNHDIGLKTHKKM